MKERRGSGLWGETDGLANMIYRFEPGDLVVPITTNAEFIGVVKDVCPKINKITVLWNGGSLKQHDPDEIRLETHQTPLVRTRMASGRRGSITAMTHQDVKKKAHPARDCSANDLFHSGRGLQCGNCGAYTEDHGKTWKEATKHASENAIPNGDQFVGDPDTHGINEPRGGGFSIMQDLQKDLHKEMKKESDTDGNPRVGSRRGTASFFADKGGVKADASLIAGMFGDMPPPKCPHCNGEREWDRPGVAKCHFCGKKEHVRKSDDHTGMKSRRAMYWGGPDRIYRLTREEQENGNAICPKCRKDMGLEPFTKSEKLYTCQKCGFKVPTSKTTNTRITIDVDKDSGEVDVDVTTAKGKKRRGSLVKEFVASPMFVLFHDNAGKNKKVAVAFSSESHADAFVEKYENEGGYKRFSADYYGSDRKAFAEWAGIKERDIIRVYGDYLFKHLMSEFE